MLIHNYFIIYEYFFSITALIHRINIGLSLLKSPATLCNWAKI
mgnify:CR=1 FL=1